MEEFKVSTFPVLWGSFMSPIPLILQEGLRHLATPPILQESLISTLVSCHKTSHALLNYTLITTMDLLLVVTQP